MYWSGSVLSAMGSQFTIVAMVWQIYELTNSALQIGFLGRARAVPQITLALFGGLLAGTVDRKKLVNGYSLAWDFMRSVSRCSL